MALFAIVGFDYPPHNMKRRDEIRTEHRAYVKANDQMMKFACAMLDAEANQCGSIYFFEADSINEVRDWTFREPFCQGDVYKDVHIIEVGVGLNKLQQMDWPA